MSTEIRWTREGSRPRETDNSERALARASKIPSKWEVLDAGQYGAEVRCRACGTARYYDYADARGGPSKREKKWAAAYRLCETCPAPKASWDSLPGQVYLCRRGDGVTKFGISRRVEDRLAQHAANGFTETIQIIEVKSFRQAHNIESRIKAHARSSGTWYENDEGIDGYTEWLIPGAEIDLNDFR